MSNPVGKDRWSQGFHKKSHNNGGATDYYDCQPGWKGCGDIMEGRGMNFNQGTIFKVAFCFNVGRHEATDEVRELNKIIYYAQRELARIEREKTDASR